MVAICDILGFSNLVKSVDLDTLVSGHMALFDCLAGFCLHHELSNHIPSLQQLREQKRVEVARFSDTVAIFARDDTDDACEDLIELVAWLLFVTITGSYTKLRAGVSYGDLYIDTLNDVYLGRALVDAHEVEHAQHWFGGALSHSAAERVAHLGLEFTGTWIQRYDVPVKISRSGAQHVSSLAVNWTFGHHEPMDFKWSDTAAEPNEHEWVAMRDVCEKWSNSRDFHRAKCRWCPSVFLTKWAGSVCSALR